MIRILICAFFHTRHWELAREYPTSMWGAASGKVPVFPLRERCGKCGREWVF